MITASLQGSAWMLNFNSILWFIFNAHASGLIFNIKLHRERTLQLSTFNLAVRMHNLLIARVRRPGLGIYFSSETIREPHTYLDIIDACQAK